MTLHEFRQHVQFWICQTKLPYADRDKALSNLADLVIAHLEHHHILKFK